MAVVGTHHFFGVGRCAPVHVDHPPVAVTPSEDQVDTFEMAILDDSKSTGGVKMARAGGRNAKLDWIVLKAVVLPVFV